MPPNVSDDVDTTVQALGEAAAVILYAGLAVCALIPASTLPGSFRLHALLFGGAVLMTAILPPGLKLLSDIAGGLSSLPSFLGEFPFHHLTLYYHPLLDREVRKNWANDLYYCTLVYQDGDSRKETLLMDNIIEPMNVSGLVFHFLPEVMNEPDLERRLELMEFLYSFLMSKIHFYQRTGSYSVSKRYLGRFSFPTANTQVESSLDLSEDDVCAINIHHVPLPPRMAEFNLDTIKWSSPNDQRATKVASYATDGAIETTVLEEYFAPESVCGE